MGLRGEAVNGAEDVTVAWMICYDRFTILVSALVFDWLIVFVFFFDGLGWTS